MNTVAISDYQRWIRVFVMDKAITIRYDDEGDYLEVLFEREAGYFKETDNDAVMEKVDSQGRILGFSIMNVSTLRGQHPLSVDLKPQSA